MEATEWKNGPHLLKFEPPDIYHCYVNASPKADEVNETLKVLKEEVFPTIGLVYFLLHMAPGLGGLDSGARKAIAAYTPMWKATIIIGGSPIMRTATNVVLRAMNLLSNNQAPTMLVKTEEDARALIAQWRAAEKTQPAQH